MHPRAAVLVLMFVSAVSAGAAAQTAYFPSGAFDDSASDQFLAGYYSNELKILGEPSLLKPTAGAPVETYRLLWLRTFDPPIAVRLEVKADGTGTVTTKMADGQAGFPNTSMKIVENVSRPVKREQVQAFLALIARTSFWSIATTEDPEDSMDIGEGGSEWVLEGVKGGKYHVVARWSPDVNRVGGCRAVEEIGMALAMDVAQLEIEKEKRY